MSKIGQLLQRSGSSLERVAKCTVMLADMKDWAAMNEAYNKFFPERRPARSSFGTTGLANNGRVVHPRLHEGDGGGGGDGQHGAGADHWNSFLRKQARPMPRTTAM